MVTNKPTASDQIAAVYVTNAWALGRTPTSQVC